MKMIRICFALMTLSAVLLAPTARADEAAPIYDPSTVFFVDLTLSEAEEVKLEAEPDEYVKGNFSMTKSSDGTPAGEEATPFIAPRPVEVRLKGNVGGSFRKLSEKPGFKLKFKKNDAVLGLRKMTLNNMVQDPSMVHETLAYAAFRANGVPASRTGYVFVRLNGEDIGVYLDLENLDDFGLGRIFNTTFDDEAQHLYEGEGGHDVLPGEETKFEVDEGSEDDISDLEALIEAVNGSGSGSWSQHVGPHAELVEMARMWAVEKYIDHWDGYSGHAIPGLRPNNYYLYSNPAGQFQMLPWGADQTWIPTKGVSNREVTFDGEGGVLFNKCLEDDECFHFYWGVLNLVTHTTPGLDPGGLAEQTADLLAPWQEKEREGDRAEVTAGEVEDGVDETLEFISGRQAEAQQWLAENKPVEPVEPNQTVDSGSTPPSAKPATPALLFEGAKRSGRQLTTHLQVSGPGKVTLRATFKAGKKQKQACTTSKQAQGAGALTLRCKLSGAAMKRLTSGPLRLKLTITAGSGKVVVQHLRLARS